MRWVPAALLVVLTATACGGDAEPEAVAGTPTPTIDIAGSTDSVVPPPVVRSPGTGVLFDWVTFDDEQSYTSTALPDGATPFENAVPIQDGTTMSRGHVFEHAGGVIGYELIDAYAGGDDFAKLAALLASSVDGSVVSIEPADVTQALAADGEIVHGDDEVMLFRIVVVNEAGDVWTGFVSGPEQDRERLESEFARLTVSLDVRSAVDWVYLTDEPSGIVAPFRSAVEPRSWYLPDAGDSATSARVYNDWNTASGIIVIDAGPGGFSPEDALALRAEELGGTVESSEPSDIAGHAGVEAVILDRGWQWVHRVVALDDHVLVVYAGNVTERVDDARTFVAMVSDAVTIP
ncbi:hypothetical protein [Jiangella sp. DSM 45060]|uniref:hypothetical protein n=1 Tax=Jiangella sp. DSM 45060 TaxID=1798224 RepID=UPI00087B69B8|nr:hypothetical protein [Jiangella sp. DSM 45060]SDR98193.1 hypothetical protein SAMN04515669_0060 [Jiangella sp. DSM 45060]